MDTTICPQCGEIAEVQWRAVLESTDGPVEHSRVQCLNRHWFLLPTADLRSSWRMESCTEGQQLSQSS